jgi:hypothetical protein
MPIASCLLPLALALLAADEPALHLEAPPPDELTAQRPFGYGRAGLELAGLMALGAAWYETEIDFNSQDFDFDRTWAGEWQRLATTRGYRFDDNDRATNLAHALVGRTYHGLARTNHATMLQAVLFDLTASSIWEAAVENREVFSLNDTVTTAIGGISLGESSYQLGEYFARSAPTFRNRLMLVLFSPARAFLSLTEGERLPHTGSVDRHGLANDASHRFELSAGGSFAATSPAATAGSTTVGTTATTEGATFSARLDLELMNLRAYGRDGQADRTLSGGEFTRLALGYEGTPERLDALTVTARSSLFGRFTQELAGSTGDQHGHNLLVAAGSAFDLAISDGERPRDFVSAVHMIGPMADAMIYRGPLTFRLSSDLYGDFAMVRPFALESDTSAALLDGAKSVLRERDYYYALGLTAAARAEARYRGLCAGASVAWSEYDSIQGLDRQQDAYVSPTGVSHAGVTDDFSIADQRLKLRVYTEFPTLIEDVHLGLSFDMQRRSGEMKDLTRSEDEGRASAVLSFVM